MRPGRRADAARRQQTNRAGADPPKVAVVVGAQKPVEAGAKAPAAAQPADLEAARASDDGGDAPLLITSRPPFAEPPADAPFIVEVWPTSTTVPLGKYSVPALTNFIENT